MNKDFRRIEIIKNLLAIIISILLTIMSIIIYFTIYDYWGINPYMADIFKDAHGNLVVISGFLLFLSWIVFFYGIYEFSDDNFKEIQKFTYFCIIISNCLGFAVILIWSTAMPIHFVNWRTPNLLKGWEGILICVVIYLILVSFYLGYRAVRSIQKKYRLWKVNLVFEGQDIEKPKSKLISEEFSIVKSGRHVGKIAIENDKSRLFPKIIQSKLKEILKENKLDLNYLCDLILENEGNYQQAAHEVLSYVDELKTILRERFVGRSVSINSQGWRRTSYYPLGLGYKNSKIKYSLLIQVIKNLRLDKLGGKSIVQEYNLKISNLSEIFSLTRTAVSDTIKEYFKDQVYSRVWGTQPVTRDRLVSRVLIMGGKFTQKDSKLNEEIFASGDLNHDTRICYHDENDHSHFKKLTQIGACRKCSGAFQQEGMMRCKVENLLGKESLDRTLAQIFDFPLDKRGTNNFFYAYSEKTEALGVSITHNNKRFFLNPSRYNTDIFIELELGGKTYIVTGEYDGQRHYDRTAFEGLTEKHIKHRNPKLTNVEVKNMIELEWEKLQASDYLREQLGKGLWPGQSKDKKYVFLRLRMDNYDMKNLYLWDLELRCQFFKQIGIIFSDFPSLSSVGLRQLKDSKKVFYSHSMRIYGRFQEQRELGFIENLIGKEEGKELINPGAPEYQESTDLPEDGDEAAKYFIKLAMTCDALIVSEFDERIGKGSYLEVKAFLKAKKPVYILRPKYSYDVKKVLRQTYSDFYLVKVSNVHIISINQLNNFAALSYVGSSTPIEDKIL